MVYLKNGVFAFVEKMYFSPVTFHSLRKLFIAVLVPLLEQLNLANAHGNLQCGLICPKKKCGIELPRLCASVWRIRYVDGTNRMMHECSGSTANER